MTYDHTFDEEWYESAWDDAGEELTRDLGRIPTDREIEDRVGEMWTAAEADRSEAMSERRADGRAQRWQSDWDAWVDAM